MVTNILSIGLIAVEKPVKIDDLHNGQGTVLYNHNMVEIMVKNEDGNIVETNDPEEATGKAWKYDSLRVEYPINADNIFRTLLNAKYDSNRQEKLINEFQSAQLGILDDSHIEPYKAFLRERIALKEMVLADAVELNLPVD